VQGAIIMHPIGRVRGGRTDPIDDAWDTIKSHIELDPAMLSPEAAIGLRAFSHLEVVFHFDRARQSDINTAARHPRGRNDWPKVGILAQRGKDRPNRIGVTICRLLSVDGLSLSVQGLDAIDGTPFLDVKPAMMGFLPRGEFREPDWARELMSHYW